MAVTTHAPTILSPVANRSDVRDYEKGLRRVIHTVGVDGDATVTHYGDAVGAESLIEFDGRPRLVITFRPDRSWAMYGVVEDRVTRLIADGAGDHRDALAALDVYLRLS